MQQVYAPDLSSSPGARSSNSLADRLTLARLSSEVRWLYGDILNEPLPESLALFVQQLEGSERMGKSSRPRVAKLQQRSDSAAARL
jgi:hypothetical protein